MLKKLICVFILILLVCMFGTTAFATGDVAGAIEGTWHDAEGQIKQVVNNVLSPCIDLIPAVFFFAKLGTAYFDTRNMTNLSGQHPQFYLPPCSLHLRLRCISGRFGGYSKNSMRALTYARME